MTAFLTLIIQVMIPVSGFIWLLSAAFQTPSIVRLRHSPNRENAEAARNAFVGWLMFGYSARWVVWPHAIVGMNNTELLAWGALYGLSALCASWFLSDVLAARDA